MGTGRNTTTRDRDRRVIARAKPPCGICEGEIDYSLRSPDPMSFEVDHIIPLAKGGVDSIENKQATHRTCNRTKSAKQDRQVILICGPAGAGKTTHARQTGLTVYDLDDPHWNGSDRLFREAIAMLATDDEARAAVIRSAATLSARQDAANLCGATSVVVLETDLETCIKRIRDRGRTLTSIKSQIAAAQDWWSKYQPGPVAELTTTTGGPRAFVTPRSW